MASFKLLIFVFLLASSTLYSQERAAWLREAKFGVMTHYLQDWLSRRENKKIDVQEWNKLVDSINVNALAEQVRSVGARYMFFTIGQNSGYYVSPNATYDKIVGRDTSRCSKRDLIADLGVALHKLGLKFIVYLPSGAPNGDVVAKTALEWKNGANRNETFQKKWEAIISEWSLRWKDKVDGWWFDGCYWPNIMYRSDTVPNFRSFAAAARAGNPHSIIAFNPGVFYRLTSPTPYEDYIAGEINKADSISIKRNYDGKIDGKQIHVLCFLGERWGMGLPRFSNEQIVSYTNLLLNAGGAITWDVPIQSSGKIYPEFIEQLKLVGKTISDFEKQKQLDNK
jgi:hypothetical protein